MRKIKSFMAMLMALVIAVTSINIPAVTAFAQDDDGTAEVAEATASDADEITDISEGVTSVTIEQEGQTKKYRFTPTESGVWMLYSTCDDDTCATLYNSYGDELLYSDDADGSSNFKLTYNMKAGETYIYAVGYYGSETTGSFNMTLEKKQSPEELVISNAVTKFLEKTNGGGYISFDADLKYADGNTFNSHNDDTAFQIDSYSFSAWIRDSYGNYTYKVTTDSDEAEEIRYTDGNLSKGKYTVVITDREDSDALKPSADAKVWATYDIEVLGADEYFAGRTEISETEERLFNTGYSNYEYYKFTPSQTSVYAFSGVEDMVNIRVYDSGFNLIYKADNSNGAAIYSLNKGELYYVGLNGYRKDKEYNYCYNVNMIARLYSDPSSVSITVSKDKFLEGFDNYFASYMNITLTRQNGTTEKLTSKSEYVWKDANDAKYTLFYSSGDEDWNANEYYYTLPSNAGDYTFTMAYYDRESGEYKKLGSVGITIMSFAEYDFPTLGIGENKVHSAESYEEFDNNIYKFTVPYEGKIEISEYSEYSIYTLKDGVKTSVSNNGTLIPGNQYFIQFYGSCYDNDTKKWKYDFSTTVRVVPSVKEISVANGPKTTDFIRGMDIDIYEGVEIKVTYSNGETETVTGSEGDFYDRYGTFYDKTLIHDGKEFTGSVLPLGETEVVISLSNEVKCSYTINAHRITEYVKGTIYSGSNKISINGEKNSYYKFTPSVSGIYEFTPNAIGRFCVCHEETVDGEEILKENTNNSASVFLDKNVVYYVDLSSGSVDKWGETTYDWTLNVGLAEGGEYKVPKSWKFQEGYPAYEYVYTAPQYDNTVMYDIAGIGIDITYDDGSSVVARTLWGDVWTDKFDNRIKFDVLKYNESTSEYETYDDSRYDKGKYKFVYRFVSNKGETYTELGNLEIPFEVVNVTDAPDGEWDISAPLYVKNTKTSYVYKVNVPDGVKSLTFSSKTDIRGMSIYDENGDELDTVYGCDDTAQISRSLDVTGKTLYVEIKPDKKNEISKITATNNEVVTAVDVSVKKTDYIYGLDHIKTDDVTTTITYADGTKKKYTGTQGIVELKVVDAEGNDCGGIYRSFTKTGDFTVVTDVLNMADTCKVNGAKISVKKFDASSAENISLGVTATERNTTDKVYTKVYKFVPDNDVKVDVITAADSAEVYVLDSDGDLEYYDDAYSYLNLKKGIEYYIVFRVEDNSTVATTVVEYVPGKTIEENIEAGKSLKLTMTRRDTAKITFVPDKSGAYSLTGSGLTDVETYIELYKGNDRENVISSADNYDDYTMTESFEKGEQYTFELSVSDNVTFDLSIAAVSSDKEIASVKFLDDTFSAVLYNDETEPYVSGEYEITYKDNTTGIMSYSGGNNYDTYRNVIQCTSSVEKVDGVDKAVVELRYRNAGESTWNYITKKYVDIIKKHTVVKELTEGVTFDSSETEDEIRYFTFKPQTTGRYVIKTESDEAIDGIDVTYGAEEWVDEENSAYYLNAGVIYKITLNMYFDTSYKITIQKALAIADVEVTGYKGHVYKGIEGRFDDDTVEIKVTFADGTTENITGNNPLKDGRRCNYWAEYNEDDAAIVVELDGMRTVKKVAYSNKNNIEALVFKNGMAYVDVPAAADGTYTKRYIYKMTIPADGKYNLEIPSYEDTYMAKAGKAWDYPDNVLGNNLKAGDVYYLSISADIEYFCVSSVDANKWQVVKEATCTENGQERRYNPEIGEFETRVIPATGHSYSKDWTVVKAAEYNKDGYRSHKCTKCGAMSNAKNTINKITSVKLGTTVYAYDGKVKKPSVVVKDSKGKTVNNKNYTVTYKNNKAVGKANVTVTFKGDYSGKADLTFTIRPAATSINTVQNTANGVKLTWTKSNGADGYIVYRKAGKGKYGKLANINKNTILSYTDKSAKNGTVYTYKVVACKTAGKTSYNAADSNQKTIMRITSSKVTKTTNKAGKKMNVKWSVNSKAGGYQIQYSVKSNFAKAKIVKVTGAKKSNVTIAKLAKKKYYVRVRSFKKVGKTTYYSAWSKKTNISIKK